MSSASLSVKTGFLRPHYGSCLCRNLFSLANHPASVPDVRLHHGSTGDACFGVPARLSVLRPHLAICGCGAVLPPRPCSARAAEVHGVLPVTSLLRTLVAQSPSVVLERWRGRGNLDVCTRRGSLRAYKPGAPPQRSRRDTHCQPTISDPLTPAWNTPQPPWPSCPSHAVHQTSPLSTTDRRTL